MGKEKEIHQPRQSHPVSITPSTSTVALNQQITERGDEVHADLTPPLLENKVVKRKFFLFNRKLFTYEIEMESKPADDIQQLSLQKFHFGKRLEDVLSVSLSNHALAPADDESDSNDEERKVQPNRLLPFTKILLRTPLIGFDTKICLVSNYLMFKSFHYANAFGEERSGNFNDEGRALDLLAVKLLMSKAEEIAQMSEFQITLVAALRLRASNIFEEEQRQFRDLLKLLFPFDPQPTDSNRKSIAAMAFCPGNSDIIAVAYGTYSFLGMHVPDGGYCCVWNIKNPINPERIYWYNAAAVSVQFSPYTPQLLAIGLYDGRIEIRDVSSFSEQPIAVSQRNEDSTCEPIAALEWIPPENVAGAENTDIEPLLALSQDGFVTKYCIIRSPYLLAFKQIQLVRFEGSVDISGTSNQTQSQRYSPRFCLRKHPIQNDIYYILTDEGCLHKCSTNSSDKHLGVLQAHTHAVTDMDFSPWSPKLFLTAGNDGCIRIWMEGILQPLITLKHETGPIHSASWSRTHSTVIISKTRKHVNIWDIRRCTLTPASAPCVDKSYCTMFKFSPCGRTIALGNERGSVLVLGLDSMPFPSHVQYQELEISIYKTIATNPELTNELKSIGFFGYPEQNVSPRRNKS